MMLIGADPGMSGAIAALDSSTRALTVLDMPVIPDKNGKIVIDMDALHGLLAPPPGQRCMAIIEKVAAMKGQGVSGMFRFGEGFGVLQMAFVAHGIERRYVTPTVWKKYFGLSRDKGASRGLATQRFPQAAELFRRVKDDGRAEAALLALYGAEKLL